MWQSTKLKNGGETTEHIVLYMFMTMPKLLFKILGFPVYQGKQNSLVSYPHAYENGIIEIERGKFSKSYLIPEIIFLSSTDYFQKNPDRIDTEITLYNYKKTLDVDTLNNQMFLRMQGDSLDEFRHEFNQICMERMTKTRNDLNLATLKVITITLEAESIEIATPRFENEIERLIEDDLDTLDKKKWKTEQLLLDIAISYIKKLLKPNKYVFGLKEYIEMLLLFYAADSYESFTQSWNVKFPQYLITFCLSGDEVFAFMKTVTKHLMWSLNLLQNCEKDTLLTEVESHFLCKMQEAEQQIIERRK